MCVHVSGQLSPSTFVKISYQTTPSSSRKPMATLYKLQILSFVFLFLAVVEAKYTYHNLIPFTIFGGGDEEEVSSKPNLETRYKGHWELISQDSGVSAMQINLMPNNKMSVYDATVYRLSRLRLAKEQPCLPFVDERTKNQLQDCFAHSMEYDIETNKVRPLKVITDPWCSCGGLAPDGTLVSSGGFADGGKTIRYLGGGKCQQGNCDWREYANQLKENRWYASQQILPNGDFIVVGGRRSFSYEFLPRQEGQTTDKPYFFPFLYETADIDENNLYPFTHLSTDGNIFVFSNNRSILLNPTNNKIVRTYPVLPGGSRNYPASGMSALLPINLNKINIMTEITNPSSTTIKAEVLICGGNTHDAFMMAETQKIFNPALRDCNRMVITDPNPKWETENMPSGRTMGDALILPNGQILFINGAQNGTAAWWDADQPNLNPVLYSPKKPKGKRCRILKASQIARMYHSTSAVLPSGKVWVAGSNTHDTYKDKDKYPTETRVEAFSPPYLDPSLRRFRPQIIEEESDKNLIYRGVFKTHFTVEVDDNGGLTKDDIEVTMYFPPFTTHGFSMNQRLLVLKTEYVGEGLTQGGRVVRWKAPPFGEVAPPGYYLLFIVHRGIPSKGMWVHLLHG